MSEREQSSANITGSHRPVSSGGLPQPTLPPQPTTAIEAWLLGETVVIRAIAEEQRERLTRMEEAIGHSGDLAKGVEPRGIAGTLARVLRAQETANAEEAIKRRETEARELGRRGTLDTAAKIVGLLLGLITLLGIGGGFILRALGAFR